MKKISKSFFYKMITLLGFVLVTVTLVAITRVAANGAGTIRKVYNFCMSTDKGYMWLINVIIAIIISKLIAKLKVLAKMKDSKILTVISCLTFIVSIIAAEILIWHPAEIKSMLGIKIDSIKDLATGIISATIVFGLYLATINYDEEWVKFASTIEREKGSDTNVCQTTFYFYEKNINLLKKTDEIC